MAVRLCQEISNRLGVTLGPWILFQAPTLKTLTVALSSNTSGEQRSPIVPLKPRGNGAPIFMIPGMYGDVMELRALTNAIVSDRPLYGIRARGLAPGETPHHSVEEIAKDYVEHLRRVQPSGPYTLVGYSFGGLVAFEVACLLQDAGEKVEFLGLVDTDVHDRSLKWPERLAFLIMRPLRYAGLVARAPIAHGTEIWRRFFRTRSFGLPPGNMDDVMSPLLQRVASLNRRAFARFRPRRYDGMLTIFRAIERWPRFCDPLPIWRRLATDGLIIHEMPGNHFALMQGEGVRVLGRRISGLTAEARRQDGQPQKVLAS